MHYLMQSPNSIERIKDEEGLADDTLFVQRAPMSAVAALVAIVAHSEHIAWRNGAWWRALKRIGLAGGDTLAVDLDIYAGGIVEHRMAIDNLHIVVRVFGDIGLDQSLVVSHDITRVDLDGNGVAVDLLSDILLGVGGP